MTVDLIDISGRILKNGDLLLNLRDRLSDPWDSWDILIVHGTEIRDLNAWNCGWEAKETLFLVNLKEVPDWFRKSRGIDDSEFKEIKKCIAEKEDTP